MIHGAGNAGVDPDATAESPARFAVSAADEAGPALGHVPVDGPLLDGDMLAVGASAQDASGVAAVRVWWRTDDAAFIAVDASAGLMLHLGSGGDA